MSFLADGCAAYRPPRETTAPASGRREREEANVTQQDSFGPGRPGPLPPPPPNYPPGQYRQDGETDPSNASPAFPEHGYAAPVYEPVVQHAPAYDVPAYDVPTYQPPAYQGYPQYDHPEQGYAGPVHGYPAPPQKTNVMAVLGLVFAFLFAPLGVVFSAIGLSQTKRRGAKGRGLALAGLIIAILAVVLEVLVIVLAVAAAERAVNTAAAASHSAAQNNTPAPAGGSATTGSTAGAGAPGLTGSDPQGVLSACKVVLPALLDLATGLQNVSTPDQYAQALTKLENTLEGATALASDAGFAQDVARLNADLAQAASTVQSGQDPAGLADTFQADGTTVGADCATAGYSQ